MLTAMGDVLREAYKRGWITSRDGNISVRMNDKLYITPSGWRKTIVHPEHIIKLLIENEELKINDKGIKPSIELEMHWNLQKLHNGTKSVVHLHPTYTIAAMYKNLNLKEIAKDFPELSRYTNVGLTVPFDAPGSEKLAENVKFAMTNSELNEVLPNIVGLNRHGVVATGLSPWDAFEHIERLEHICQIVLAAK